MRQTSIEVFQKIKESGMLSRSRWEIFEVLYRKGPMTASQVFEVLGKKTNQSGRFTELEQQNAIKPVKAIKCPVTGNKAILWCVTGDMPTKLPKQEKQKCLMCGK